MNFVSRGKQFNLIKKGVWKSWNRNLLPYFQVVPILGRLKKRLGYERIHRGKMIVYTSRQPETYEKNYSLHDLELTTAVATLKSGRHSIQGESVGEQKTNLVKMANLELMKTCSLTSLFILVVLRWIESGSRLDDEGIWKSCQRFTVVHHNSKKSWRRLEEPDLSSWFCFTLRMKGEQGQTAQIWRRLETIYFECTDIEANLYVWMSWFREGWSYWRRVFTALTHLSFVIC